LEEFKCTISGIKKAAEAVLKGGVVVYPTDTIYGIGCNPYNEKAILRVIEIKAREERPLPVLCSSVEEASELVELSHTAVSLAQKFWPGPLTIVSKIIDARLPRTLSMGRGKLGVRIPDHECALALIELAGGRLVGTSANKSGLKSPTSAEEVKKVLPSDYDILLDGGSTPLKAESTVVEIVDDEIKVLREKAIPKRALGL
jgi:L-threonylcarbamoyladenylate synthase